MPVSSDAVLIDEQLPSQHWLADITSIDSGETHIVAGIIAP